MEKGNKKVINAWATYDLANSVYNLVITATIFPIYYKAVTTIKDANGVEISNIVNFLGVDFKNTALYDFALATAYLIIAFLSPLLSGIADYSGSKKRFMQFFSYLGALSCTCMYFFDKDTVWLGILLAITACIGYSGSLVFYNAYLPEIAPPEMQDKVSAKGFAMGYIGSSVLLIFNLMMVQKPEWFGIDQLVKEGAYFEGVKPAALATRFSFLTVGIWWFGFAQIPFAILPNNKKEKQKMDGVFLKGYKELAKVWAYLKENKSLTRFLTAFFIYSMGVQTVMLVATHFGAEEVKMQTGQLITTILIIQFVAMGGAYLFSFISKKRGNLFTLKIATVIWSLVCIFTFQFVYTPEQFYVVAAFVGLVMGGIQSLSRSTYSKLLPATKDPTSFFSFYDVAEKMSIVCGMLAFGLISQITSGMRKPIVVLIIFFVAGFLLLIRIPKTKEVY